MKKSEIVRDVIITVFLWAFLVILGYVYADSKDLPWFGMISAYYIGMCSGVLVGLLVGYVQWRRGKLKMATIFTAIFIGLCFGIGAQILWALILDGVQTNASHWVNNPPDVNPTPKVK